MGDGHQSRSRNGQKWTIDLGHRDRYRDRCSTVHYVNTMLQDRIYFQFDLPKWCHSCMLVDYHAAMAELVDALDSGSSRGNSVDVRVILAAIYG